MKRGKKLCCATLILGMLLPQVMGSGAVSEAASGKWRHNAKGWWYSYSDGSYAKNTWEKIGGKWKLPILCSLSANGESRYNELLKNIRGISNTMLSKTLREMEDDGLVTRSEYLEVPIRVEYALTDTARQLQPILIQLIQWSLTN